jgi:NAD(P)-dependent dehydrogenase (short-subunit alcohol dehydrogenase family)
MSSITTSNQKRRTVLITGCSDGGLGCALVIEFQQGSSHPVLRNRAQPNKGIPSSKPWDRDPYP